MPTIWQGLLSHLEQNAARFSTLRRTIIGGAACPPAMIEKFEKTHGVHVIHGWGMTETSPCVTASSFKAGHLALTDDQRLAVQAKQRRVLPGVDIKVVAPECGELPWDGSTSGELMVKGHWVLSRYFREKAAGR